MEIYKQIRKMRLDGMSQRQIAATLHISRNTVKKYWDGDSVPWERKDYSREASVLTEDVVAFVRQCLDEDNQCRSKKQHHTAKRIYDRLVAERGFAGGETTVRRLVKELREKNQEAFVPLIFPAGDALQIDWGEATVYLSGIKTTVNLFCARLCYSGVPMVLAYRRQNEESFLDALVQVFQYFGGVPKRVIFDNGKVAVKDGFGAHARKQVGYAALAAHYGFEAVFCNPASGNERAIFYARPVQETLPAYFLNWLQEQNLSPKELVEILSRCREEDCDVIMAQAPCHAAPVRIEDTVVVQAVDLHAYDAFLCGKTGAAV